MLTGSDIRRMFLEFFKGKGHKIVHSSSLVPANDPTLLFTNAGMNQFKDVFLGLEKREYSRATTSQKCVRAGGKHNDLENVGFTNRHHTFFEMLGNFSFGDYFKKDAVAYAWELITSEKWFGIAKDKLYVTIFEGDPLVSNVPGKAKVDRIPRDDEAEQLWLQVGVAQERIKAFGRKDNFWQMGDTGPCGPCSEIHYDMGVAASDRGHTDCKFGCDCGRYVELWNLVFMQYDRQPRVEDKTFFGLTPLPKPSIDTGAGLERLASVLQGVISNYDTDLFMPLIKRAAELTGTHVQPGLRPGPAGEGTRPYANSGNAPVGADALVRPAEQSSAGSKSAASLRVIADHSRAATFLISDGVTPSNEGRGYVLRKIIRRAITHGRLLGQTKPFLNEMVFAVRDLMQDAYPELNETAERVSKAVLSEETRFAHTFSFGIGHLEQEVIRPRLDAISNLLDELDEEKPEYKGKISEAHRKAINANDVEILFRDVERFFGKDRAQLLRRDWQTAEGLAPRLSGRQAFDIFQTFGLPRDFIEDFSRDSGIPFDTAGFEAALKEERERARASWKGAVKQTANPAYQELPQSAFEGYRQTRSDNCEVLAIIKAGQGAQELKPGDSGEIILDHTPFYAESGGQVGDRGWLYSDDHNTVVAEVTGCYYPIQGVRAHQVTAKQPIRVGQKVDAVVNKDVRAATMRNHTATHLLHAGLREVLGKHVKQAGSLVAPNHLRFDFSHFTGVEDEELQDIEDIINKEVLRNEKVEIFENVPIDVAVNEYHAMALFGEKYGDKVRVIKIGDFSTELCGGIHTGATGEIGLIKILKEGSVSSGVRRIEAVTGEGSLHHFRRDHKLEEVVAGLTSATGGLTDAAGALVEAVEKRDAEIKRLTRELDQARMKSASSSTANIGDQVKEVHGIKVLAHRVDNLERPQMRTLVDQLRDKLGSGVVVLGSATDGNVSLIAGVTKDLTSRIQAGKVVGAIAQKVGGKGGGRPDLAEAGGKDAAALDSALAEVYKVVSELLNH
jgi:alanyl-tRNA synthetase